MRIRKDEDEGNERGSNDDNVVCYGCDKEEDEDEDEGEERRGGLKMVIT